MHKEELQNELSELTYGELKIISKAFKLFSKRMCSPAETIKLLNMMIRVTENSVTKIKEHALNDFSLF